MKELMIKNSYNVALVDDEDFENLKKYTWNMDKQGYLRASWESKSKRKHVRLHRMITNAPNDMDVDHIDGNPLNNQKSNLRICPTLMNGKNRGFSKNNISGYKGVSFKKETARWYAHIGVNYKRIHIGYFDTALEAAQAYDMAAKENFGEFAVLNFPESRIAA